jgi:hypothetical protein
MMEINISNTTKTEYIPTLKQFETWVETALTAIKKKIVTTF